MSKFTAKLGCYGDGALGHQHTRERCADIVDDVIARSKSTMTVSALHNAYQLCDALRSEEMSDDAGEEIDACEWLNSHWPHDDAAWEWRDGDFGLWPNDSDDD